MAAVTDHLGERSRGKHRVRSWMVRVAGRDDLAAEVTRDLGERLLLFAGQDLRMAELAMTVDLYAPACLHCQLCAERAMKALLVHQGRTAPGMDRLADLLVLLDPNPLAGLALAVQQLDRFHVAIRCPDAALHERLEGLPDAEDAWQAVAVARETLMVIGRAMAEL